MKRETQFGRVLAGAIAGLLTIFMTVEIAHGHGRTTRGSDIHCSICAVAHHSTVAKAAATPDLSLRFVALVPGGEPRAGSHPDVFIPSIRPPPASVRSF